MNIFTHVGNWVERHFPEKMTAKRALELYSAGIDELKKSLAYLDKRVYDSETKIIKLNSEIETLKTQSTVKMRVSNSTPSNMTPFASKFPSIGGNQSPR